MDPGAQQQQQQHAFHPALGGFGAGGGGGAAAGPSAYIPGRMHLSNNYVNTNASFSPFNPPTAGGPLPPLSGSGPASASASAASPHPPSPAAVAAAANAGLPFARSSAQHFVNGHGHTPTPPLPVARGQSPPKPVLGQPSAPYGGAQQQQQQAAMMQAFMQAQLQQQQQQQQQQAQGSAAASASTSAASPRATGAVQTNLIDPAGRPSPSNAGPSAPSSVHGSLSSQTNFVQPPQALHRFAPHPPRPGQPTFYPPASLSTIRNQQQRPPGPVAGPSGSQYLDQGRVVSRGNGAVTEINGALQKAEYGQTRMQPRIPAASAAHSANDAARQASSDQLLLMQRLADAAKQGGLAVQPIFTKTSWVIDRGEADTDQAGLAGSREGQGHASGSGITNGSTDVRVCNVLPPITKLDARNVKTWLQRDLTNIDLQQREKAKARETLEELAKDLQHAQDWLGKVGSGPSATKGKGPVFRLRTRKDVEKEMSKGKRKARPWLEFTKKQLRSVAEQDECLIPIRLDLDHEGRKCNDTFTWNLNDTLVTPAVFATLLCDDLLLPNEHFHSQIVNAITDQIKQYQEAEEAHPRTLFVGSSTAATQADGQNLAKETTDPGATDGITYETRDQQALRQDTGMDIDEEDAEEPEELDWWEGWRKKVKLVQEVEAGQDVDPAELDWTLGTEDADNAAPDGISVLVQSETGQTFTVPALTVAHEELRIPISLDISVDRWNLRDRFEWDLADPNNCPEDFAAVLCADLGLPGEFLTAISHSIREQIDTHARSLASIRHIRGDQIVHDELRTAFFGPLADPIRGSDVEAWTPYLTTLNLMDMDHREKERERQSRRQKRGQRNNRRNAIALPDRDPLRTSRTIMPKPGASLDASAPGGPASQANSGSADNDAAALGFSLPPSYEIAQPYELIPPQNLGTEPTPKSPLRRNAKLRHDASFAAPPPFAAVGDGASATGHLAANAASKIKPPGKRRGRPPLESTLAAQAAAAAAAAAAASASSASNGAENVNSPFLSLSVPPSSQAQPPNAIAPPIMKRPVGRPPKYKAGWQRTDHLVMHPNFIDGKWHCTNCGVPEPIAVGRRKGPSGANTQCAECGKFYMSNKGRLRPCEYTTDPSYHMARAQGFNPMLAQTASQFTSNATTPVANADSPTESDFQPGSDEDDYKPDDNSSVFDDFHRSRAASDVSMSVLGNSQPASGMAPHQNSGTGHSAGAGKGKGKSVAPSNARGGKGKGAGKQLPPMPPRRKRDEDDEDEQDSDTDKGKSKEKEHTVNKQAKQESASPQPEQRQKSPLAPGQSQPSRQGLPIIKLSMNRSGSVATNGSAGSPNREAPPPLPGLASSRQSPPHMQPNPSDGQPRGNGGGPTANLVRRRPEVPKWLGNAMAELRAERPTDRFEVISKPGTMPGEPPEWRLKCLDCPGKVYKTGPGETLDNFSAHLRFKGHRQAVAARTGAGA